MSERYKVIGGCEVAGTQNGEEISHDDLVKAGANIDALLGVHLEPVGKGSRSTKKDVDGGS